MEKWLANVRVLMVDDEADAMGPVALLLQQQGAVVRCETDPMAAMGALDELRPHVLICDLSMPGEDGYSLLSRVRALPPEAGGNTPAIAFSAFAFPEYREMALRAGFQRYLAKPMEPQVVAQTVASLVATLA